MGGLSECSDRGLQLWDAAADGCEGGVWGKDYDFRSAYSSSAKTRHTEVKCGLWTLDFMWLTASTLARLLVPRMQVCCKVAFRA